MIKGSARRPAPHRRHTARVDSAAGHPGAAERRPPAAPAPGWDRWLAVTALAYALLHHVGSLPDGLGPAGHDTRWADWIDLLTPYAVLVPAGLALRAARSPAPQWVLFAAGALLYAQGHGVHLAANSVGNTTPGPAAHLWDEVVGHALWYAGVALVAGALALAMRGRPRPRSPLAWVLALAVGTTWATNAIGGGTSAASLLAAGVAVGAGWRERTRQPVLLAVAGLPAVVVLAVHLLAAP